MAQTVKRLLAMQEAGVQSLGWEDPLEKEMATHSSTLAWKIPWMEKAGRLQSMGSQRVGHDFTTTTTTKLLSALQKIMSLVLQVYIYACMCVLSLESCPPLCDPVDCSPPGASVHGLLQARILEWVIM